MNYPNYHGLEGLRTCTDAQMPPYQASTFTFDGVNITKQPERITLEPSEMTNVQCAGTAITNRPLVGEIINKPSIVTNAISTIMPPAGNTLGLRECMLVKGKEEKQ
jgi:hypothetical protein